MESETILQGTDGIRGRISTEKPRTFGKNALSCFLESGYLTPSFFEHYTFAYASLLQEIGEVHKGDPIVIGWDPRDREGTFNEAAISGIRKAGLKAVVVGILPTPAIPLYMLSIQAAGSVVLTASHNPSDQNGIKLFNGWTALKFLPADDALLSGKIFEQQEMNLADFPETGGFEDQAVSARHFFIQYQTDPRNSWVNHETFKDQILVIDASKGAVSTVLEDIFGQYQFHDIIYTNLEGDINESCGVADFEGQEFIQALEVTDQEGRFHSYETLQTLIKTARSNNKIQTGDLSLSGLVFDGDGDRCFRLDYDPVGDRLIISSGDQLGIHLARHIKFRDDLVEDKAWFINTVESDLKTAITAEEEGYKAVITGVGDKWILKKAILDMIRAQIQKGQPEAARLRELLTAEESGKDLSGIEISTAWKTYLKCGFAENSHPDYRYQVGIEESGHSILPGYIETGDKIVRCFAGNGIKSGLNALVAIQQAVENKGARERINYLAQPFPSGIKTTLYTYYVNKNNLLPGSVFREKLEEVVRQAIDEHLPDFYRSEQIYFAEETTLIYFKISQDEKTAGAVFIRNSGTEDKSALYMRGEPEIETSLAELGNHLHLFLLKGLKKQESDFVLLESDLLRLIAQGLETDSLRQKYPSLPYDRVLKEVEFKEGLINSRGTDLTLTEKGKILNDYWERQV